MVLGSDKLRGMLDAFMDLFQAETEFSLVIYNPEGRIIRATDKARIGQQHPGVEKIIQDSAAAYVVTAEEAAQKPLPPQGCYCPLVVEGRIAAVLGIMGEPALAKPMARIASRMFNTCLEKINDKQLEAYAQVRRIQESERRIKELFDDAPVMYVITESRNGEPYIQKANTMFLKTLGYRLEEVTGTPLKCYYDEISRQDMIKNETHKRALSGNYKTTERCLISRDGRQVHTYLHSVPNYDENGKVCGTRAIYLDITARKRAEQEAERLEAVLVQAQKMEAIGTLAGGIAHDFNNILSAIIGYAQLSLADMEHNSRNQHNLNQILTAGMRARDLVSQILTFSRQQDRELVPLQMEPLVKEALKLLRASLPSTIEIVHDIAGGLDNVKADPTQIQQILMNLCTNAAHAMEAHGGRIKVQLDQVILGTADRNRLPGLRPGSYLRLRIHDTGPGIPVQVIDRIFHPFFTTKAKGKGTGLGLSVVHGIVKSLNGAVTVKNESGQGCEFIVFIPAIKCQPATGYSIPAPWPTGNERVLLVDDEPFVKEIGQKTLERLGYKVTACNSSLEALEVFKKSPDDFDLVISDITMPKMTGDELAERLLQIKKDVPIILCTGYSDRFSGDQAEAVGARAFLMKPVVPSELAHTVRSVLGTKGKSKCIIDRGWTRCA